MLAMGAIYREWKEYPKAVQALERSAEEFIGQPGQLAAVYSELGRVDEEKGDRAKADEVFQKALAADEQYSPAYFHYARFLSADARQASKAKTTAQEYLKRDPRGNSPAKRSGWCSKKRLVRPAALE